MDHEEPGNPDLTIFEDQLPLLPRAQWERFCRAYIIHTGNEYYPSEWLTYVGYRNKGNVAIAQWKAWLQWVAVYKLTGDGRGSFAAGEG